MKEGKKFLDRLADQLVSKICGNGHAKLLMLRSFNHQQNPKNERQKIEQFVEKYSQPKSAPAHSTEEKPEPKKVAEEYQNDMESAEDDDGLRGVKSYERPLVDEKENQARYPTRDVAKQARDIFLQAAFTARNGRRRRGRLSGWSLSRRSRSRLRCAALCAKCRARGQFRATLRAECHGRASGRLPP